MKKADYERRAARFRGELAEQAARPRGEQQFPEDVSAWPSVAVVAECRTPGCPVAGRRFEVELHENADGIYRAVCGRCGQPHTHLVPQYDDGPGDPLPTGRPARPPVEPPAPVKRRAR